VVYRGFDEVKGIEVAWNKEKVSSKNLHEEGLNRLEEEVKLLKNIRHKNIIKIYASWVDKETNVVNFITEIFNSGTLRQCVPSPFPPSPSNLTRSRRVGTTEQARGILRWASGEPRMGVGNNRPWARVPQVRHQAQARGHEGAEELGAADSLRAGVPARADAHHHPPRPEVREHLHQRRQRRGEDRGPGRGHLPLAQRGVHPHLRRYAPPPSRALHPPLLGTCPHGHALRPSYPCIRPRRESCQLLRKRGCLQRGKTESVIGERLCVGVRVSSLEFPC